VHGPHRSAGVDHLVAGHHRADHGVTGHLAAARSPVCRHRRAIRTSAECAGRTPLARSQSGCDPRTGADCFVGRGRLCRVRTGALILERHCEGIAAAKQRGVAPAVDRHQPCMVHGCLRCPARRRLAC
jgi:hypothetical protein